MNLTKTKIAVIGTLVLTALSLPLVLQHQANTRLAEENARLRELAAHAEALREENTRLGTLQTDPAELARLREEQKELLRLRGELTRLRSQLAEGPNVKANLSASNSAPAEAASPVETYSAVLSANIPAHQTLLTGGWRMTEGKRTFVFITPETLEESASTGPRQVQVGSHFVEMPEEVVARLGWDQFKTDANESKQQALFTEAQFAEILSALRDASGVSVLSAPVITTLDGRQAQVKVVDIKTIPGGEKVEIGPSVNFVPYVAADGSGVKMSVVAQIRRFRSP